MIVPTRAGIRSPVSSARGARSGGPICHGGLGSWRLRRIVDYVEAHLADEIGLDTLAELASLSRAQFFRAFRQSTGCTPARYVERLRIDRARSLVEGGHGIDAVARKVGLTTSRRLTTGFRRCLGMTPDQYRRASG